MLNNLSDSRCKVWERKDKGKYTEVKFTTSRRVNESVDDKLRIEKGIAKNGYVPSSFAFVRFVGKAHEKIKTWNLDIPIGNLKMAITNERYVDPKTMEIKSPQNNEFVVFDFDEYVYNGAINNSKVNMDKAPKVEPPVEEKTEELSAEDECPF